MAKKQATQDTNSATYAGGRPSSEGQFDSLIKNQ